MKFKIHNKEEQPEIIRLLRNVPLFSSLNDKALKSVVLESREVSYPAGKVIVKEGGSSFVFHLVLDGAVEIQKHQKRIAKLGKGEFFGEMGILTGEQRSADVVAIEPTRILAITSWDFKTFLRTNPSVSYELLRTLALRLSKADQIVPE